MSSVQLGTLSILIAMLGFASTGLLAQSVSAFCENGCSFDTAKDGTTIWKDNNIASSKAESAAVANSQNTVKCFAFCIGSSTANAGSAATSNANSPTNTQTITKTKTDTHDLVDRSLNNSPDTMESLKRITPTAGTACIDNTGSISDEGFGFGYNDAQNGQSIASIKDHGHHTDEWRTGYRDGFQLGLDDLADGKHKQPC